MSKTQEPRRLPPTLTREQFAAVADHCYHVASATLAKDGEVPPVLMIGRFRRGKLRILAAGFVPVEDASDKAKLTMSMQLLAREPRVDFVVHITEAWMLHNPVELPADSIAAHPQRQEAVIFNILSRDCQILVVNPLHRDPLRLERGEVNFSLELRGSMARPQPTRN